MDKNSAYEVLLYYCFKAKISLIVLKNGPHATIKNKRSFSVCNGDSKYVNFSMYLSTIVEVTKGPIKSID